MFSMEEEYMLSLAKRPFLCPQQKKLFELEAWTQALWLPSPLETTKSSVFLLLLLIFTTL